MGEDRQPFEEKIPGTLVRFRMVPLPDGRFDGEGGTREVLGLWMGETEVTWDLYDVWAYGLDLTPEEQARGVDAESRPSRPYGSPDRGFGHKGYPALGMTHQAAERFCLWLLAKTGRRYRLPSEWEWEYAARAGATEAAAKEGEAWTRGNSAGKTHPVASKSPSAWGLFDILGNVAEWCSGEAGPSVRGGSFQDSSESVSSKSRAEQTPRWNESDPQFPKSRWWLPDAPFVGFRVVCEGGQGISLSPQWARLLGSRAGASSSAPEPRPPPP